MFQIFTISHLYLDFNIFDVENLIFYIIVFNNLFKVAFIFYVIYSKKFFTPRLFLILLSFDPLGNYYDVWTAPGIQLYFFFPIEQKCIKGTF